MWNSHNGALTAAVNGNTTGYDFSIQNSTAVTVANSFSADTLASGTYTITATDNSGDNNGCQSQTTFTVKDSTLNFNISNDSIQIVNNTNCNPANGQITIKSVAINNTETDTANFSFQWFDSENNNVGNNARVTNQQAGNYKVLITDSRACISDTFNISIQDDAVLPNISVELVNSNYACGNSHNGALTAAVNGNTTGYDFSIQNSTAVTVANSFSADTLASGTYTITATDNSGDNNGCQSQTTFTLQDSTLNFNISNDSIQIVNNTNCNPANGQITITSVAINNTETDTANFSFQWFDSENNNVGNNARVTNQQAGNYKVLITDSRACISDTFNISIQDDAVLPNISVNLVNSNYACGNSHNGALTAAVNGNTTGYDFSIQNSAAVTVANSFSADTLASGTYTITATDNSGDNNGCQSQTTFTLQDSTLNFNISNDSIQIVNNTNCNPANGQITITSVAINNTETDTANFSFQWFDSENNNVGNNARVTNQQAGNYKVLITDSRACISDTFNISIQDDAVLPNISVEPCQQQLRLWKFSQRRFNRSC